MHRKKKKKTLESTPAAFNWDGCGAIGTWKGEGEAVYYHFFFFFPKIPMLVLPPWVEYLKHICILKVLQIVLTYAPPFHPLLLPDL